MLCTEAQKGKQFYEAVNNEKALVQKAKSRPSENNPVCTPGTRREYVISRVKRGIRAGDTCFEGEEPIVDFTRPLLYTEDIPEEVVVESGGVQLPPSMRD